MKQALINGLVTDLHLYVVDDCVALLLGLQIQSPHQRTLGIEVWRGPRLRTMTNGPARMRGRRVSQKQDCQDSNDMNQGGVLRAKAVAAVSAEA